MKGTGTETAQIVNILTHTFNYEDPDEYRVDPHNKDIPYDWARKDFRARSSERQR